MYWYYKVFFVVLALVALFGIYSLVSPYLPDTNSFSKPVPVEKVDEPKDDKSDKTDKTDGGSGIVLVNTNATANKVLSPTQEALLLEARKLLTEKQKLDEAYEQALAVLNSAEVPKFSKGWYKVADFINEINTKLSLSSAPSNRKVAHKVAAGDSLSGIARGKTTGTAIQKGNSIPLTSQNIHPGDYLRFFPGPWEIEVVKDEYVLILYHQQKFFKYYKVGVGRENRTPEGIFTIYGKVIDPTWERKGQETIPAGDPRNVLGTRWMKLIPAEGTVMVGSGYGIHGTTEPNTVGTPASEGCIRMKNEEVEELFDLIPDAKVKVTIRK